MSLHHHPRLLAAVLLFASALPWAHALEVGEALPAFALEDATGSEVVLLETHNRIYATADRKGGKLIEQAMEGLDQTALDAHNAVLITEISKAPGFVRGMIKSGLEDRSYINWVDDSGRTRKLWPYRKNHVTVIDLHAFEVQAIRFERDLATLKDWLTAQADEPQATPETPEQEQD